MKFVSLVLILIVSFQWLYSQDLDNKKKQLEDLREEIEKQIEIIEEKEKEKIETEGDLESAKRQKKEMRVVEVPLEKSILNLKILKESGRIEESLSYLFNRIYMDLVTAKYSRKKGVNETIRDFAIVSVRELKLNPAIVYPFIQKIEEVIYHPFKVSDRDFYDAVQLFSPIYFELTGGFNFNLSF